ncbi:CocE/NonD family hydrolase [Prochlorococcus marinus]|uniref:CocE/NonD family hydrolase n=1 Tax=Prochlorococcus marinus TaxID=1219 RepID=UPI0022B5CB9E|nr:CocE/NonD family hydrolase [Prochlorococcus marinus]
MFSVNYHDKSLILKDGVKLSSRIWQPIEEGPWPALLMRQPYGKQIASTVTYAHPSWWASQGYLVVIQDVRGQGSSEGEFCGFEQEASDTTQTHKWIRSLPECNGLLGTYGFSYQGLTQLLGELNSQPPDCLAPAMTGIHEGEHWSCEGGAFWWDIGILWGLQLASQKLLRKKDHKAWNEIRESLEKGEYLRNGADLLKKHDPTGMASKWLLISENNCQEWKVHKPLKSWLSQPMILIGGWKDPHLKGILTIYEDSLREGGSPELHIGPASHLDWWEGTNLIQLNFFNKHLKLNKTIDKKPLKRIWNITNNSWHTCNQSHEPKNKNNWVLCSRGLACSNTQEGTIESALNGKGEIHIVHDPWRPVPSIGGHLCSIPEGNDRSKIDQRGDVATFTSLPFTTKRLIEGIPKLKLAAKSDTKGFDLCIALSIIYKNDLKVNQLSTGVLRIRGDESQTNLNREITLQALFADFPKGSQLRLSISGASWPAIAINPGTNQHKCGPPSPDCLITTISIDLSKSKLSIKPFFLK